jgi:hypothetical protein
MMERPESAAPSGSHDPPDLVARVEELASIPAGESLPSDAAQIVNRVLDLLESGEVRSARKDEGGTWRAVHWVKRGILLAFRAGTVADMSPPGGVFRFFDKQTIPPRPLNIEHGVRVVPGGSSIRRGAYVAPGVVCMPPMFVNAGAWVGRATMIDSHALVGSCAQIGERVHLSAAAQIGGVLEPVNAAPVIVEDDVVIGGNWRVRGNRHQDARCPRCRYRSDTGHTGLRPGERKSLSRFPGVAARNSSGRCCRSGGARGDERVGQGAGPFAPDAGHREIPR